MRERTAVTDHPNRFLLSLFGFEKVENKAHFLLIVIIHVAGWCLLFFLPVLLYPVRINDRHFINRELIDKAVLVLFFYLNYYFFIPRLFEKKKYLLYALVILAVFGCYFSQRLITRTNFFLRTGGRVQAMQVPMKIKSDTAMRAFFVDEMPVVNAVWADRDSIHFVNARFAPGDTLPPFMPPFPLREPALFGIPRGAWLGSLNNAISSFALLLLMGGFIRLSYSFIRNQNEKKALENANLNAEVNFLKSQINPHFLFNTLNSIYAQAHSRSDNTEFSILKLSELLRYVLYESGESTVDLAKDIRYLTNYIDLQKIRLSSKVKIRYSVNGKLEGSRIAPLLLITFIENAFKHGISYTYASTVNISIDVFEETLTLLVSNPLVERNSFAGGGLGLKNVTRRLDLLYPGKYLLDIHHDDHLHVVNLKLDLKND